MNDIHVAIISAGRPGAPAKMAPLLAGLPPATWYVPEDEIPDYERFADIVVAGGGLVDARNAALYDADVLDKPCLQLSDDLTRIERLDLGGQTAPTSLLHAVGSMANALAMLPGARLAGVAPTNNAMFGKRAINERGFCVGDMIYVLPHSDVWFDPRLRLKEDYDFTAQHLAKYGKVARCDWILASFTHSTNPGGAVAYRTPEVEQEAIAILKEKWPKVIRDNPKRPNEILFRWPTERALDKIDVLAIGYEEERGMGTGS